MTFDFFGKDDPKIVKRVYRDLNGQARNTADRSIHQKKIFLKMLM